MRHGQSRNESVPVEDIHHLAPDSPSRLAGKPRGGTGGACVDDDRRGTVGRVRPCARPVGRLAVGVRGPPCPNLVGWTALAGSLSASGGSGETTLATGLRDEHPSKPPTISHALPSPSSDVAGLPSGLSAGSAVLGQKRSCRPAVTTVAPSKRCQMIGRPGAEKAVARRSIDPVGAPRRCYRFWSGEPA